MKRTLLLIIVFLSAAMITGCGCRHDWNPATCNEPMTCCLCGATDGESLEHCYDEATCSLPRTCSLCGTIDGMPLGHRYENATCTELGVCILCHQPGGDLLPHTPCDPITSTDYLLGTETVTISCTECGAELESTRNPISLISDKYFVLTAPALLERLNYIYSELGMTGWESIIHDDRSGILKALVLYEDNIYATITFNTSNIESLSDDLDDLIDQMTPEQRDDPIVCQLAILINFYDIVQQTHQKELSASTDKFDTAMDYMLEMLNDADIYYHNIVTPVLKACDPAMTDAEIEETFNIYTETSLYASDDCGELSVQYINGFLLMMCHIITISTSADFNTVAPN